MIGQTISHYRILKKLGEGGMGVVYIAEDILLERRVAIKTLNVEPGKQHYRQRFLREARAVSALNHPNIAIVHDYGETPDGKPFIVMELVEGETLEELLSQGALTLSRVLEIIEDITKALAAAHRRGIIHRDIKPSNVIINESGEVKVLDFGLAKSLNTDLSSLEDNPEARALLATRTREGVIIGTPLYVSPEQALGLHVDARSDIFSLGSLLYECLTGKPAFDDMSAVAIYAKVIRDDPTPPSDLNPDVPPEFDSITLKLLAKKPDDRYQSADELLADFSRMRSGLKTDLINNRRASTSWSAPRLQVLTSLSDTIRRPHLLTAAFLMATILGVLLWLSWPFGNQKRSSPEALKRYREGTEALRDGTYFKASKLLENALSIDNDMPLAHARLAEALVELDNTEKAKEEIDLAKALARNNSGLQPLDVLYLEAISDIVLRNFDAALGKYQVILQKISEADAAGTSYAYLDLGRAFEKKGALRKAVENYLEATRHDPQQAAPFLRLGILYSQLSNPDEALVAFDRAENLFQLSGNYEGVTEVLFQRGSLLSGLSDKSAEAWDQLKQALNITRTTTKNKHQEIRILLKMSNISCIEGETETARKLATDALSIANDENMENLTTKGLIELGNTFHARREFVEAEKYAMQALNIAQKYKGSINEAGAKLLLGKIKIQREFLDDGIPYIEQALKFYKQGDYHLEISEALLLLGRAKHLKGDDSGALQEFDEAIKHAKEVGDLKQEAGLHIEVGYLLLDQGMYPAALNHYNESFRINKSLNDHRQTAYSLMYIGDTLWRLGDYDKADDAFSQALVDADRIDSEYRSLLLTRLALSTAKMELSKRNFAKAIAKSREASDKMAGKQFRYAQVEAKYTQGLALVFSGAKGVGKRLCEEALKEATVISDERLKANALLALAEAQFASGDNTGALANALRAQEAFARFGQQESGYRTALMAVLASQRLGDGNAVREHGERARELLSGLEQKWGAEAFYTYIMRDDIRFYREQLKLR